MDKRGTTIKKEKERRRGSDLRMGFGQGGEMT